MAPSDSTPGGPLSGEPDKHIMTKIMTYLHRMPTRSRPRPTANCQAPPRGNGAVKDEEWAAAVAYVAPLSPREEDKSSTTTDCREMCCRLRFRMAHYFSV